MTEDLVFLQWLRSLDEEVATKFVVLSALVESYKAVDVQEKFLPVAYQQLGEEFPNLGFPDVTDTLARAKDSLKELCRTQGWGSKQLSIKRMAEASDLVPVYDFFYSLSSNAVHSNVHGMGRMVWGTKHAVDISSKPFEGIHADLSVVYGTWLFDALLDAVKDMFEPVQRLLDSQAYVVRLALILVGPARNGRLPLMIHPEELRHP